MKSFVSYLTILIFLSLSSTFAQNTYDFLRLDMSAKAAALGGSYVSNADNSDVIFYNPAGMNFLSGNPISVSYLNHLLDINLASISYSTEFPNIGRFGAGIAYINYGSFDARDDNGNKTGEFHAAEAAFMVGYTNLLSQNFSYGANLKYIYSGIADRNSSALAVDLGLHYSMPEDKMELGFAVLNAGAQLTSYYSTKEELPLDITFGASKTLEHLPLTLSLDFHKLNLKRDNFFSKFRAFDIGAEFKLSKALRLRLGYNNERREELKIGTFAGLAGFNIGAGIVISNYNFDYGFSSFGLIGGLHRISVSTSL